MFCCLNGLKMSVFSLSIVVFVSFISCVESKIFDCFMFFNEFDVLEIRLHELYDEIDYFVVVESDTTFQGDSKPLFFDQNRERFAHYLDKIIYVAVKDMPITHNPWEREAYQRNAIIRGLNNCENHDAIIISDVDEIPSREAVQRIRSSWHKSPVVLEVEFRTFWFNIKHTDPSLDKILIPIICSYEALQKTTPERMRDSREQYEIWRNCGWHLNNAGGEQAVDFFLTKIRSFSHAECNTGVVTKDGIDALVRTINHYGIKVPDDATYPHLVLENWENYQTKKYIRN